MSNTVLSCGQICPVQVTAAVATLLEKEGKYLPHPRRPGGAEFWQKFLELVGVNPVCNRSQIRFKRESIRVFQEAPCGSGFIFVSPEKKSLIKETLSEIEDIVKMILLRLHVTQTELRQALVCVN